MQISSTWVQTRLHTENQLPRLPGSALKVPGWGGRWWVPTHYQFKLKLMLRLSWAVTINKKWHSDGFGIICSSCLVTYGNVFREPIGEQMTIVGNFTRAAFWLTKLAANKTLQTPIPTSYKHYSNSLWQGGGRNIKYFRNKSPLVGGYYNGVKYDLDQTVPGGCSLDLN